MAALPVLDLSTPSDVTPYWARPYGSKAEEEKISLSSVSPKIDILKGPPPADCAISIKEFLNPAIMGNSDQHISLTNSSVAALYEMRECVIPQIVTNNGDYVDLQSLEKNTFLSVVDICLLDQSNWLQSIHGTREINTEGNHDQKFIRSAEAGREAGMNIFPGIRVRQEGQRDVVKIHGHHLDSPAMIIVPARMAAGIYDDMVSKGAAGAATAKLVMKLLLSGLGYDKTYRNVSHQYDANLETGHVHLVELLQLSYKKELSQKELKQELSNFGKNSFMGFILSSHKTGALENFIVETVIPKFREVAKEVGEMNVRIGETLVSAGPPASLTHDAQKMLLKGLFSLTSLLPEATFRRIADQMLHVLEKDPGVSLLEGLTVKEMRPPYREKTPPRTESGVEMAVITVPSCMIDERATSGFTYAKSAALPNGGSFVVDWAKAREQKGIKEVLGLPDKMVADNDLVERHFRIYPGLHPNTLKQIRFIYAQAGVLSDDETREYSKLPALKDMPTVTVSPSGDVRVKTPDGRPLARAEMPEGDEVTHPRHILHALEQIDVRTANDMRKRMKASPELKSLFGPGERFIPDYRVPVRSVPEAEYVPLSLVRQP